MNLTTAEFARAVAGRALSVGRAIRGVSTDTRTLQPGDAFFALVPRPDEGGADGHAYLDHAAQRGASAAVVCRPLPDAPPGLPLIEVDDTLLALGRLGAAWRSRMPARILAVTGSVGKTTTKGMVASILEACAPTVTAERSFNNEIGVPLTLLRLNRSDRFCVLEFAMRGPGEIRALAELARPEIGVITNIGLSHVGRLGSVEAIAEAKAELLPLLPPTGVAVLNRQDAFFEQLAGRATARVLSFGQVSEADVRAEDVALRGLEGNSFVLHVPGQTARVELSVPGEHSVQNALAAAAAAYALGVDIGRIVAGLSSYAGEALRGLVRQAEEGYTVIADCYNASPTAVRAALDLLGQAAGRRVFVFGDMAELGEIGPDAHRAVGEHVARAGVAELVTIGDLAQITGQTAAERGVTWTRAPSTAEAVALLRPRLRPGDVVLVKGSRVMRLEDVVEGLLSDA